MELDGNSDTVIYGHMIHPENMSGRPIKDKTTQKSAMLVRCIVFAAAAAFLMILATQSASVQVQAQQSGQEMGPLEELGRLLEEAENISVTDGAASSFGTTGDLGGTLGLGGQQNLTLISQRYNEGEFSDRIVGEISNSGIEPARFVEVIVSFYDANGLIVGTENGFAEPSTIGPGDRAPFAVLVSDDAIEEEAGTYDLTIDWRGSDFDMFNERVLEGVPISGGTSDQGQEEESDDDDESE